MKTSSFAHKKRSTNVHPDNDSCCSCSSIVAAILLIGIAVLLLLLMFADSPGTQKQESKTPVYPKTRRGKRVKVKPTQPPPPPPVATVASVGVSQKSLNDGLNFTRRTEEPSACPIPDSPSAEPATPIPPAPTHPFEDMYPGYPVNEHPKLEGELKDCAIRLLKHMRKNEHYFGANGWPHPDAIIGTVMVTDGNGGLWRQETEKGRVCMHCGNVPKYRAIELTNTVLGHMKVLKKPTIIFLSLHDVDYWTLIAHRKFEKTRNDINSILDKCPMIWLAHYNPCTMDHKTGRLPRRSLVVPDFYRFWEHMMHPPQTFDTSQIVPKIVWRGTSLGLTKDLSRARKYKTTDRYRAVATLSQRSDLSDMGYAAWGEKGDETSPPGTRPPLSMDEQAEKYQVCLDVDGIANTWEAFRYKLGVAGAVYKAYSTWGCTQWYYPELTQGKEVVVFDTYAPDEEIFDGLKKLLSREGNYTEWTSTKMGQAGYDFARKHLTYNASQDYLTELITTLWEKKDELEQKDWRVKGFGIPNTRLSKYKYDF